MSFSIDVIGVGAPRSGTSWLYECLARHPDVCMSRPKELNFFLDPSSPASTRKFGEAWYQSRFRHRGNERLAGEISPLYFSDPSAAHAIATRFPDAKILVQLRHPVDALLSFYAYLRGWSVHESTFDDFVRNHPEYVDTFDYATHLERIFRHVPRHNVHVILYDDIRKDPATVWNDVCAFLGIASADSPHLGRIVNGTRADSRIYAAVHSAMRKAFLRLPVASRLYPHLRRIDAFAGAAIGGKERPLPQPSPATLELLRSRYRSSTSAAIPLLGKDISHWIS